MDTGSRRRPIWVLTLLILGVTSSFPVSASGEVKLLAPVSTLPTPPDPAPSPPIGYGTKAAFGKVLAEDGRTIIAGVSSGHAAYAYKESTPGNWTYDGILLGPDGSVAFNSAGVSDDVALVGGATVDQVGFVYVFHRAHGEWQFVQKISEPEPEADTLPEFFGYRMAVSGDVVVISNFTDRNSRGAVYVYRKTSDGGLVYQEKLSADDGSDGDSFGWSVATDGEQILVGSQGSGGAAYIFQRVHRIWTQEQKLISPPVPPTSGVQQDFGFSVAISGRTAVVASPNADFVALEPGSKSGATFVFVRRGNNWHVDQKLVDPHAYQGLFGQAVAVKSGRILVSAWGYTDPGAAPSERIYLFDRDERDGWMPTSVMSEGNGSYSFGYELAWSGRFMITSEITKPLTNPVFEGQVDVYKLPRSINDDGREIIEHGSGGRGAAVDGRRVSQ